MVKFKTTHATDFHRSSYKRQLKRRAAMLKPSWLRVSGVFLDAKGVTQWVKQSANYGWVRKGQ